MLRIWTVLLLAMAIAWAGCGGAPEEEAAESLIEGAIKNEGGQKPVVEISKDRVSIQMADGASIMSSEDGVEVPEDFPEDVLLYEGAKAVSSLKTGHSFIVSLRSKDSSAKIAEVYREKMKAGGWELENSMAMDEGEMLHFSKDERKVMLTLSAEKGETSIALMVEERP